ncbi:hypothetical protein [Lewinella sp. IMCC34191]|uniref:hypothetical protein n=1 Tax=Lewinella sp. IMCC34191 TaxID=2259172 RepID=UPI000E289A49|nr:hypothetical protein [Lewinella sp. IMCC34191]
MYESSPTLDDNYGSGASLSTQDAANLRKAGKWARFIAIFSMAALGLVLLGMIVGGSTLLVSMGLGDGAGAGMMVAFVFYGAFILFALYMLYLQYKFGSQAMQAVDNHDGAAMSESLAALSRYYKIYGIIMLVYLALMTIGIVFAVIGGAFAAFG